MIAQISRTRKLEKEKSPKSFSVCSYVLPKKLMSLMQTLLIYESRLAQIVVLPVAAPGTVNVLPVAAPGTVNVLPVAASGTVKRLNPCAALAIFFSFFLAFSAANA